MSGAPRLTVITICRNARAALARTVASVLAQPLEGIEYWIVDGVSTDGTIEDLAALEPSGVRWISEPDRGISDAMNKGVRLAAGQWIAHLHAGDEYLPGALDSFARARERRPEAEVLCGFLLKHEPAGEVIYHCDPARLPRDMTVNHPATFVRRDTFLAHGGFDARFRRAMDYDLFLRLERAGTRFAVIPEPLAAMEYGGLSERSLWETLAECEDIRRARLVSGFARTRAYTLLLYARGLARRGLQRIGLDGLVRWYRRRFAVLAKG
jgi:glycosyltransferase involved in cell wall biosynthesis